MSCRTCSQPAARPVSVPSCGCTEQPCGCRVSPPRVHRQRLREQTPAPVYKRNVIRNSTPEPDVIERTHVRRQPRVIIDNVTEQPMKPPPRVVNKVEYEPAEAPIVRNSCVKVTPRSGGYYGSSRSYRSSSRYYDYDYDDYDYGYSYSSGCGSYNYGSNYYYY